MNPLPLPPPVGKGRIAIVAPSAGTAARYPQRLARGIAVLERHGHEVVLARGARSTGTWTSAPIAERVRDIHWAFESPDVTAVFCTIGGRGASQLLSSLDVDLITEHPKAFVGYSDVTALHLAIATTAGFATFYGPSVMSELGEIPRPHAVTERSLFETLEQSTSEIVVAPAADLVDEHVDWSEERERRVDASPSQVVVRDGRAEGVVVVGCLPVVRQLVGTPWRPDTDGAILVVETPQLPYSMGEAMSDLWQLRNAGMLDGLAALVVGWPFAREQLADLTEVVTDVVAGSSYPVVVGMPVGHTSPMVTIPLGRPGVLESGRLRIAL